jgi:hypothetical protein
MNKNPDFDPNYRADNSDLKILVGSLILLVIVVVVSLVKAS